MEKNNDAINRETSDTSSEERKSDLRKLRESKSLTLRDIEKITRISHTVLEAIEAEEFETLPEPVYTTAFIKKYAEILGVDGDDILNRYNAYVKERQIPEREDELLQEESWIKSNRYLLMWGVFVIIIVSFFVFYFFHQDYTEKKVDAVKKHVVEEFHEGPPSKESEPVKMEENIGQPVQDSGISSSVIVNEEDGEEDVIEGVPEESVQETSENERVITDVKGHSLTIKASELTWLKISQDDTRSLEYILRPGENLKKKAKENFRIVVGNAGGVDIIFDGKSLGSLGIHGEVVHLDLP
jgi:cytoskeleton protein RodZ